MHVRTRTFTTTGLVVRLGLGVPELSGMPIRASCVRGRALHAGVTSRSHAKRGLFVHPAVCAPCKIVWCRTATRKRPRKCLLLGVGLRPLGREPPPPPPGGPRIGGLWPTVHCHRSRRQESLFAQVPRRSTGTQVTRRKFCSWLPVASSLLSTMHPNTLTFNLTLVLALHSVGPVSNRWQDHGGGCRGTAQGDAEAH